MQQIFIIVLLCSLFFSCSKDEPSRIDRNKTINIRGDIARTKSMTFQDSNRRVVEYSFEIMHNGEGFLSSGIFLGTGVNYTTPSGVRRDLENDRFIFSGGHVMYTLEAFPDDVLLGDFITNAYNVLFIAALDTTSQLIDLREELWIERFFCRDTVGYIPNAILRKAQQEIITNFNAGNYERCYQLFDTAFVFRPTTGAKWLELKAKGIE